MPTPRAVRLCYGIALALPAAMAWFVLGSVSNAPIYDEWLWSPLIVAMHDGTLHFSQLWQQQNSHRSVLPTVLALGLAALTHWDTRFEALLSVVLIAVAQLCVFALLIRDRGVARAAGPFVVASLLLYSLAQVENLLWGFQLSWFLVDALTFMMIVALAPRASPPDVVCITFALVCAVAASYSMISGFAAWIAGATMIAMTRRAARLPLLGGALFLATGDAGLFMSWQIAGEERDLAMRIRHIASVSDAELRRAFTNNYRVDQPGFVRAQVRDLDRFKLGPFNARATNETALPNPRMDVDTHVPQPVIVPVVQPKILGVVLDRPSYRWGDLVHIDVVTTTNTAAVEVTTFANIPMKLPFRLHQTGLGEFSGLARIPFEPPIIRVPTMAFIVDVTALGGEGTSASRRLALNLASAN